MTHEASPRPAWVLRQSRTSPAQLRLFCFPYAGVGPSAFRPWFSEAPPGVELCLVQLPGREGRWSEPASTRLTSLVPLVAEGLLPDLSMPYAFFGHSLGALLAFEVARYLRRRQTPGPVQLFLSAHRAPQLPNPHPPLRNLPDDQFVAQIRKRYDGIPQAVFDNPELLELMLPTLRADFSVFETYEYHADAALDCPIAAFGGLEDSYVKSRELEAWSLQTSQAFSLRMLPGDHFFIQSQRSSVLQAIGQSLARGRARVEARAV